MIIGTKSKKEGITKKFDRWPRNEIYITNM